MWLKTAAFFKRCLKCYGEAVFFDGAVENQRIKNAVENVG